MMHSSNSNSISSNSPYNLRGHVSDSPLRSSCWRTESVLYIFIDIWLRYDVDANRELPSSEFINCVRFFIKILHSFGNSADLDQSPMYQLRQIAQPMLNAQIYTFLRSLINRWPLDSSFAAVLELWLSYIQPWRYNYVRQHAIQSGAGNAFIELPQIPRRFEYFIKENLAAYTQILVQLLPRFVRLDLSSLANVAMMHRLLRVFAQSNLAEVLRASEFDVYASKSLMTSSSPKRPKPAAAQDRSVMTDWSSYRADVLLPNEDDTAAGYVCMFGDEVQQQIRHICEKMLITRKMELDRLGYLETEMRKRHQGLKRYLKWLFVTEEDIQFQHTINDCRIIPENIDRMLQKIVDIFMVDLTEVEMALMGNSLDWTANQSNDLDVSLTDFSGASRSLNSSVNYALIQCLSSGYLSFSLQTMIKDTQYMVDPAQVPTKSNEITFMVRALYQMTTKLNLMVS